jgi:hypothetical protein
VLLYWAIVYRVKGNTINSIKYHGKEVFIFTQQTIKRILKEILKNISKDLPE